MKPEPVHTQITNPSRCTHRSLGTPHPSHTTARSAATTEPHAHTRKSTTSATCPGHTPAVPPRPAPASDENPMYPTRPPPRSKTRPNDRQPTTHANLAATETAALDPPTGTHSPHTNYPRQKTQNRRPTHPILQQPPGCGSVSGGTNDLAAREPVRGLLSRASLVR
jgi:hypothetical protein